MVQTKRHIAKTITYRFLSSVVTFTAIWWASGSVEFGAKISLLELLIKPLAYYLHERVWYRCISFGIKGENLSNPE
jgi:uncharacterized membrane protein